MLGRSSIGFRPSFLKTYTVWRPASWRCQFRFTDQSDALGKRRGRLGICRARQILVSGRTSKSLWGLESSSWTQPPERHSDGTWKGLGYVTVFCVQRHCVLARTHTLSCGRTKWCTIVQICQYATAWSMPSTSSTRMSCKGRQLRLQDRREPRSERSLMGTWNLHANSHRLGYFIYIFTFLPRPTAQENEVLKFPDLREEDAVLDSGAECAHTHMMQYVEVCELLAGAQETYYIMKQLAILWQAQWVWWKVFSQKLDNIQECLANLSSFPANYQLPSLKRWGACRNAHTAGVKE